MSVEWENTNLLPGQGETEVCAVNCMCCKAAETPTGMCFALLLCALYLLFKFTASSMGPLVEKCSYFVVWISLIFFFIKSLSLFSNPPPPTLHKGQYRVSNIQYKATLLLNPRAREKINKEWKGREKYINQLIKYGIFFKENAKKKNYVYTCQIKKDTL